MLTLSAPLSNVSQKRHKNQTEASTFTTPTNREARV